MNRLYCTLAEVLDDLEEPGVSKEAQALKFVYTASNWIDENLGKFIPVTEARRYDGNGRVEMMIDPILAVTSIVSDEITLLESDYLLYPRQRCWENGPYTRMRIGPDATSLAAFSSLRDSIVVTGRYGLYERSVATGATTASQLLAATSLVVDDASGISPGAVLLIGSEQELVRATGATTESGSDLDEELDASEEEVDVSDGTLLHAGETIKIDFEQMKVLDIKDDTLLVERGYNGSKKTSHESTAYVYVYRTFTVERGVNGTTAAAHTTAAVSRYAAPDEINYLCRQIAALMFRKAKSGYAGRTGNTELGTVFYHDEFPRDTIEKIRWDYYLPALRNG